MHDVSARCIGIGRYRPIFNTSDIGLMGKTGPMLTPMFFLICYGSKRMDLTMTFTVCLLFCLYFLSNYHRELKSVFGNKTTFKNSVCLHHCHLFFFKKERKTSVSVNIGHRPKPQYHNRISVSADIFDIVHP